MALDPVYANVGVLRRDGVPLIAWVAGNSLANLPAVSPRTAPVDPFRIGTILELAQGTQSPPPGTGLIASANRDMRL